MNGHWSFIDHLAAVPALLSTASGWNSQLAVYVLAFIAIAAYIQIAREVAGDLRGE